MKIAIFGASCTGKTVAARALADRMQWELRSCGDIVRQIAKEENTSPNNVSEQAHRTVDAATIELASTGGACVIEGRYLDQVLHDALSDVLLIELLANQAVRCKRMAIRNGRAATSGDIAAEDDADLRFRGRMYADLPHASPAMRICTDDLQVSEVVDLIEAEVRTR